MAVGRGIGRSRPVTSRVQPLAWLSLLGLTCFTASVAALHVLRPDLDPTSRFLSEYALGPYRLPLRD